ncbi:hypothetical protein ACO0LM_03350 [Undibacterium sp. Di26W]|uniref:hypothetical protein n=1 Tax=Undibacterium sp. Di26W TaxID=3413035 RepID=UPI003BF3142E
MMPLSLYFCGRYLQCIASLAKNPARKIFFLQKHADFASKTAAMVALLPHYMESLPHERT